MPQLSRPIKLLEQMIEDTTINRLKLNKKSLNIKIEAYKYKFRQAMMIIKTLSIDHIASPLKKL
jgi:hypothetical protein